MSTIPAITAGKLRDDEIAAASAAIAAAKSGDSVFSAVGFEPRPPVTVISQVRNTGSSLPDFRPVHSRAAS